MVPDSSKMTSCTLCICLLTCSPPHHPSTEEESAEMVKQKLEQQYATIQLQPLISSKGSTPVSSEQVAEQCGGVPLHRLGRRNCLRVCVHACVHACILCTCFMCMQVFVHSTNINSYTKPMLSRRKQNPTI